MTAPAKVKNTQATAEVKKTPKSPVGTAPAPKTKSQTSVKSQQKSAPIKETGTQKAQRLAKEANAKEASKSRGEKQKDLVERVKRVADSAVSSDVRELARLVEKLAEL